MKIKLLILSIAALCLSATPAVANIYVHVDIDGTEMTLTNTDTSGNGVADTHTASITLEGTTADWIKVQKKDTSLGLLDDVKIEDAADFAVSFTNLNFVQSGGTWSTTTGDLTIDDTGATKFNTKFKSVSISLNDQFNEFEMTGKLYVSNPSTSSILVPTANSWTFNGESGTVDSDNQVTISPNAYNYDSGICIVAHFDVHEYSTLAALFGDLNSGNPVTLDDGDIELTIVPIPAAVILGVLGLGVAGLKLRKFA